MLYDCDTFIIAQDSICVNFFSPPSFHGKKFSEILSSCSSISYPFTGNRTRTEHGEGPPFAARAKRATPGPVAVASARAPARTRTGRSRAHGERQGAAGRQSPARPQNPPTGAQCAGNRQGEGPALRSARQGAEREREGPLRQGRNPGVLPARGTPAPGGGPRPTHRRARGGRSARAERRHGGRNSEGGGDKRPDRARSAKPRTEARRGAPPPRGAGSRSPSAPAGAQPPRGEGGTAGGRNNATARARQGAKLRRPERSEGGPIGILSPAGEVGGASAR